MTVQARSMVLGLTFLLLVLVVLVIWFAWPDVVAYWTPTTLEAQGLFGDSFGALNALFSGLAFAGLIYAILLQREELKLQRKELADTRKVLDSQRVEFKTQNATLAQQTFDNTFFQLLRLHNDIVNATDLRGGASEVTTQGRDCFAVFYKRFKKKWEDRLGHAEGSEAHRINDVYLSLYENIESDVGHYFRSLYNIFKFIDQSDIANKRRYTNLVRAQLSTYETLLLFYNCLSDLGSEKFKPLVEKYALLEMVQARLLLKPKEHRSLYRESAYG